MAEASIACCSGEGAGAGARTGTAGAGARTGGAATRAAGGLVGGAGGGEFGQGLRVSTWAGGRETRPNTLDVEVQ